MMNENKTPKKLNIMLNKQNAIQEKKSSEKIKEPSIYSHNEDGSGNDPILMR